MINTAFDNYSAYCMAVFLATIIPGPSMMVALSHGIRYGIRRTLFSAFGNMAASLLQALIAILAIYKVNTLWTSAFVYIQLCGALYLAYLGVRLMCSIPDLKVDGLGISSMTHAPALFWQGFAVAIFNPKAILFFSSLFPQFIRVDQALSPTLFSVLLPICVISVGGFLIYAGLGTHISSKLFCSRIGRHLNIFVGGLFIVLCVMSIIAVWRELEPRMITDVQDLGHVDNFGGLQNAA
jgi:homoserine/homoserine lactone efflux protein